MTAETIALPRPIAFRQRVQAALHRLLSALYRPPSFPNGDERPLDEETAVTMSLLYCLHM